MAFELLEFAIAVQKVSGSISGRGSHKNLCGCRGPSGYVSFLRGVKRQWFHTVNTRYTSKNNTTTFPYKRFTLWNWISIRSQQMALISSGMINSAICCTSEKRFPPTC